MLIIFLFLISSSLGNFQTWIEVCQTFFSLRKDWKKATQQLKRGELGNRDKETTSSKNEDHDLLRLQYALCVQPRLLQK